MIKKAILATMVLVVAPAVLWVTDPGGYPSALVRYFKVEPSVDMLIELVKGDIEGLDKNVLEAQEKAARLKAHLDILEEDLPLAKAEFLAERDKLQAMQDESAGDEFQVSLNTSQQRQFRRYQAKKRTYNSKQAEHDNLKKHFEVLRETAVELKSQKQESKLELAALEAELARIRTEEIRAKHAVDKSRFRRLTERLKEIRLQVKTRSNLLELRTGEVQDVSAPASDGITWQTVKAELGQDKDSQLVGK